MLVVRGRLGRTETIELGIAAQRRLDTDAMSDCSCAMRSSICCRRSSTDARLMRPASWETRTNSASARRAAPESID